jgi:transcriptional regulator with GAF, ATPase, and Fis domain
MTSDEPTLVLTEGERADRARIVIALSAANENPIRAAQSLGLSLRVLRDKIARYRIPRPPPTEAQRAEIEKYGMPQAPEPCTESKDPEEGLTGEQRAERAEIIAALSDLRQNTAAVAARLGLRPGTLNAKIERYRIPLSRLPDRTK